MAKKNQLAVRDRVSDLLMKGGPEAGKALFREALANVKIQHHHSVVSFVEGTMKQLIVLRQRADELENHIQFQESRLKAIEEGAFTVGISGVVTFNNGWLNG